ncbi:hypothetical protein DSM3645_27296 [Blastopirellula marina DSM 3645]|uniref:Uncharacterized protein n=1 Tax=Blastopirellula marina DSM 3645 TaxID=314230 RepID=A4A009_9BACT|nr:hypothetical protein DSM3645_27296 [Blastopirellula marina DSM 3645]
MHVPEGKHEPSGAQRFKKIATKESEGY